MSSLVKRWILRAGVWGFIAAACVVFVCAAGAQASPADVPVLTLDEALERALARSPALGAGRSAVQAAEARERAANARFYPRLALQGRYSRLSFVEPGSISLPLPLPEGQPQPSARLGEPIENQTMLRLSLEQPLFTGFALLRAREVARAGGRVAQAREEVTAGELRLRVHEAYIGLLRVQGKIRLLGETLDALQVREEHARLLAERGRLTELDLLRVQAQRMSMESALERAVRGEGVAREALALVIGLEPGQLFEVAELPTPGGFPELAHQGKEGVLPELRLAQEVEELRELQSRLGHSSYYPQVALLAGTTFANPNERYFPPENAWNGSWDVSVVFNWQFDSLAAHHEARARQFESEESRHQTRALEEQAQLEVLRQGGELESSLGALPVLARLVAVNERALEDAELLFELGRIGVVDLLDRELDVQRSRLELFEAELDAHLAVARLRRWQGW